MKHFVTIFIKRKIKALIPEATQEKTANAFMTKVLGERAATYGKHRGFASQL